MLVITGTSSGLGAALFSLLKDCDEPIVCIARRFSQEQRMSNATLIAQDFVSADSVFYETIYRTIKESCDNRITFINNAGVVEPIAPVGEILSENFEAAVKINFSVPSLIVNAIMEAVLETGKTLRIIDISTGAAVRPLAGWGAYCASKAAVRMFLDCLAEQEPERVAVVHFDPGVMDTQMQEKIRDADFPRRKEFVGFKQNGKLKSPEDVAREIISTFLQK